jgi:hypothetical protein
MAIFGPNRRCYERDVEISEEESLGFKVYHIISPPKEYRKEYGLWEDVKIESTEVYPSSVLLERLPGIEKYPSAQISPESVDIPLTEFREHKTRKGWEIASGQWIFAKSPIIPEFRDPNEFICLESKTGAARSFLPTAGFLTQSGFKPYLSPGDAESTGGMEVYLMNRSTVPYVLDEVPCYTFQITLSRKRLLPASIMKKVKILNGDKDISREVEYDNGEIRGYLLSLSPDIWCMKRVSRGKIRYSHREEDAGKLFVKGKINEIDGELLKNPSLTVSREKIKANCPAYVFPLHLHDMLKVYESFIFPGEVTSDIMREVLLENKMTNITGNAGLLHMGSENVTIFENTPDKRLEPEEIRTLLEPGKPYALVIPLSFTKDYRTEKYRGNHWNQKGICL